ncbi:MAG: WD40 repeat domain-containing protein, partial [Candidatus Hermodarchaeota archaeon]
MVTSLTVFHPRGAQSLAWSPDGNMIASTDSGDLRIFDAVSGEFLRILESDVSYNDYFNVAWSPDGKQLAANTSYGSIFIWDVETGNHVGNFLGNGERANCFSWSQNGQDLAAGGDRGLLFIWNKSEETIFKISLPQMDYDITALAWNP